MDTTITRGTGTLYAGTSGWHYRHWREVFYPPAVRPDGYLRYYAERFRTVEINNSFYRLPDPGVLETWRRTVPPDFVFAAKASRYITEAKKLKDPGPGLVRLFERLDALGAALGVVLFQLPPRWRADAGRLRDFLAALPRGPRYAFEFRDPSWYDAQVFELLERRACALCVTDYGGTVSPLRLTAGFTYVRLHGPDRYPAADIALWAGRARRWLERGTDVYFYFNNDRAGHAVRNARELQERLPEFCPPRLCPAQDEYRQHTQGGS